MQWGGIVVQEAEMPVIAKRSFILTPLHPSCSALEIRLFIALLLRLGEILDKLNGSHVAKPSY